MSGRKGMKHYKVEIKQEAIRLVQEEHMAYTAVATRLGIRTAERIEAWVGMYRREGELSFHKPIGENRECRAGSETVTDGERRGKKIPYRIAESAARAAQYRAIYHHKEEYEVKTMCEFFGVSRAAYYAWEGKLGKIDPDQERMEQIRAVYEASHKSYGYRLPAKTGAADQSQGCFAADGQAGDSFASQKAQNVQKVGRNC